jgi:meiotic recombination protein REC8, fungi type
MFYSPDILKRKEGFSVIWWFIRFHLTLRLAATLGAKSVLKKLQKREILSVDVPRACAFVSGEDEPLALRLSSNLMYGVTRVYSQQYQFFYGCLPSTMISY